MPDPITAAELYEIVKDLSKEEWPEGIRFGLTYTNNRDDVVAVWIDDTICEMDDARYAYRIFVGHLAEKALAERICILEPRSGDPEWTIHLSLRESPVARGPTLLHALVAYFTRREQP